VAIFNYYEYKGKNSPKTLYEIEIKRKRDIIIRQQYSTCAVLLVKVKEYDH
jgi:hypothetical protein